MTTTIPAALSAKRAIAELLREWESLTAERDAMRERCRTLIDDLTALSTMPGVPDVAQMAYQDALSGLVNVMYPLGTPIGDEATDET